MRAKARVLGAGGRDRGWGRGPGTGDRWPGAVGRAAAGGRAEGPVPGAGGRGQAVCPTVQPRSAWTVFLREQYDQRKALEVIPNPLTLFNDRAYKQELGRRFSELSNVEKSRLQSRADMENAAPVPVKHCGEGGADIAESAMPVSLLCGDSSSILDQAEYTAVVRAAPGGQEPQRRFESRARASKTPALRHPSV